MKLHLYRLVAVTLVPALLSADPGTQAILLAHSFPHSYSSTTLFTAQAVTQPSALTWSGRRLFGRHFFISVGAILGITAVMGSTAVQGHMFQASAPAQTGLESFLQLEWPYQEGTPLALTDALGANVDDTMRLAMARSPDAKRAWEEMRSQALRVHALTAKHGVLLFRTDNNLVPKISLPPLKFTAEELQFLFEAESGPRSRVETLPNTKKGWGKVVGWLAQFAGGVSLHLDNLPLQDKLEITQAALDLSMAAAHLVEVCDEVGRQVHQSWWTIVKAKLQKIHAERTLDWQSGLEEENRQFEAAKLKRSDAPLSVIIQTRRQAVIDISNAEKEILEAENALLRLMRAGDQRKPQDTTPLFHPQLSLPSTAVTLAALLGPAAPNQSRADFVSQLQTAVQRTTPTEEMIPLYPEGVLRQWAESRRKALPEFVKEIQNLSGPHDPRLDNLLRRIFLPYPGETSSGQTEAAESHDVRWSAVIDPRSLLQAQLAESPREEIARLRIHYHAIDQELIRARGKSGLQLHWGPQFNALVFVNPFLLFAPRISGQVRMDERTVQTSLASLDAKIAADKALATSEYESVRERMSNAHTRLYKAMERARLHAQEYEKHQSHLMDQWRDTPGISNNFITTAEASGASLHGYQRAMAEGREAWEILWQLTPEGQEATRLGIENDIWKVLKSNPAPIPKDPRPQAWASSPPLLSVAGDVLGTLTHILNWIASIPWITETGFLLTALALVLRRPAWLMKRGFSGYSFRILFAAGYSWLFWGLAYGDIYSTIVLGLALFFLPMIGLSGRPAESLWARQHWMNGFVIMSILMMLVKPINALTSTKGQSNPNQALQAEQGEEPESSFSSSKEIFKNPDFDIRRIDRPVHISAPAEESGRVAGIASMRLTPAEIEEYKGTILLEPGVVLLRKGSLYTGWEGLDRINMPIHLQNKPESFKGQELSLRAAVDQIGTLLGTMGRKSSTFSASVDKAASTPRARFTIRSNQSATSRERQLASVIANIDNDFSEWQAAMRDKDTHKANAWAAMAASHQAEMETILKLFPSRNIRMARDAWVDERGHRVRMGTELSNREALEVGTQIATQTADMDTNFRPRETATLQRLWVEAHRNAAPTVVRLEINGQRWDVPLTDIANMKERKEGPYENRLWTTPFPNFGAPHEQYGISLEVLNIPLSISAAHHTPKPKFIGFFESQESDKAIPLDTVPNGTVIGFATAQGFSVVPLRYSYSDLLISGNQAAGDSITAMSKIDSTLGAVFFRFQGSDALQRLANTDRSDLSPLAQRLLETAVAWNAAQMAANPPGAVALVNGVPPATLVTRNTTDASVYPFALQEPILGMPEYGTRTPELISIAAAGELGDQVTLVGSDGHTTLLLRVTQTQHPQRDLPQLPQSGFAGSLDNPDTRNRFLPPHATEGLVRLHSDRMTVSNYEQTRKELAEKLRKFLNTHPLGRLFTLVISIGALYAMLFSGAGASGSGDSTLFALSLFTQPLTTEPVIALSLFTHPVAYIIVVVALLFIRWKAISRYVTDYFSRESAGASEPPSAQATVTPGQATSPAYSRTFPRKSPRPRARLPSRRLKASQVTGWHSSSADMSTLLFLLQGSGAKAPSWAPYEIEGGQEEIIVRLTRHAGLRNKANSARRLARWGYHRLHRKPIAESRTEYFKIFAWLSLVMMALFIGIGDVMQLVGYANFPVLNLTHGIPNGLNKTLTDILVRLLVILLIASPMWQLSQATVGLKWVLQDWAYTLTGIQRDILDFNIKMRDEIGLGVVSKNLSKKKQREQYVLDFIKPYLDAEIMDGNEQANFHSSLRSLAGDLVPIGAALIPSDAERLSPSVDLMVSGLYDYCRQMSDGTISVEGAYSLDLPLDEERLVESANIRIPGFAALPLQGEERVHALEGLRLDLAREAMLDPERQLAALMALAQIGFLNMLLARRPEAPPVPMQNVVSALIQRFKTLNPTAHDEYRRVSRLYQPWQLTAMVNRIIRSPANRHSAARAAIVKAFSPVFTPEDAFDLRELALLLRDPNDVLPVPEFSKRDYLEWASHKTGAVRTALDNALGEVMNDRNGDMPEIIAYILARRLCLVDREAAENLMTQLDGNWRHADPSTYLDTPFPFLGPVPADLIHAGNRGALDMDRILKSRPTPFQDANIIVSFSLMPSRRAAWSEIERLLRETRGNIRVFSNSTALDGEMQGMNEERIHRLGPGSATRVRFVESRDMDSEFRLATPKDIIIFSAEPREFRLAAQAKAWRLHILHGLLLNDALIHIASRFRTSIEKAADHQRFLDRIGVSEHVVESSDLDDLQNIVFPRSVVDIPLIPPEVQLPLDVVGGSIEKLGQTIVAMRSESRDSRPVYRQSVAGTSELARMLEFLNRIAQHPDLYSYVSRLRLQTDDGDPVEWPTRETLAAILDELHAFAHRQMPGDPRTVDDLLLNAPDAFEREVRRWLGTEAAFEDFLHQMTAISELPNALDRYLNNELGGEALRLRLENASTECIFYQLEKDRPENEAEDTSPSAAVLPLIPLTQDQVMEELWQLLRKSPKSYKIIRDNTDIPELGEEMPEEPPASLRDYVFKTSDGSDRILAQIVRRSRKVQDFERECENLERALNKQDTQTGSTFRRFLNRIGVLSIAGPVSFGSAAAGGSFATAILLSLVILAVVLPFRARAQRSSPPARRTLTPDELDFAASAMRIPARRLQPDELDRAFRAADVPVTGAERVVTFARDHQRAIGMVFFIIAMVGLAACGAGVNAWMTQAVVDHAPALVASIDPSPILHTVQNAAHAAIQAVPPVVPDVVTPHITHQVTQLAFDEATKTLTIGQGDTLSHIAKWATEKGLVHGNLYGDGGAIDQIWEIMKSQNHGHHIWDKSHIYMNDKINLRSLFPSASVTATVVQTASALPAPLATSAFQAQSVSMGFALPMLGFVLTPFIRRRSLRSSKMLSITA